MTDSAHRPDRQRSGRALCLSGGGFRAALFHAGALRRLNEAGLLAQLTTISSVSGGSIASGLLARLWPTFRFDAAGVVRSFGGYEAALREVCAHDLRTGPLLLGRLNPLNWPALWSGRRSATDLLARAYDERLTHGLKLGDLPTHGEPGRPRFVFCASNLQTGVSFELSGGRVGDYLLGYARAPELPVALAVAASSAFPVAFPPLVLALDPERFTGGRLPDRDLRRRLARRVVLSDGGVYDNMGLEPVWKTHRTVLVSDGGKPFAPRAAQRTWLVPRLLRVQDVIGNQALALRRRWLVASLERGEYDGAYWGLGTEIGSYPEHGPGFTGPALTRIREVRTDLDAFRDGEQRVLLDHGWALADAPSGPTASRC